MEIPKLNELIESLDENDAQEAPVKGVLVALRGAPCVNNQSSMFEHLIPWIRADRDRVQRAINGEQASRN